MLLVDHREPQVRDRTPSWISAWVPKTTPNRRAAIARSTVRARLP